MEEIKYALDLSMVANIGDEAQNGSLRQRGIVSDLLGPWGETTFIQFNGQTKPVQTIVLESAGLFLKIGENKFPLKMSLQ